MWERNQKPNHSNVWFLTIIIPIGRKQDLSPGNEKHCSRGRLKRYITTTDNISSYNLQLSLFKKHTLINETNFRTYLHSLCVISKHVLHI